MEKKKTLRELFKETAQNARPSRSIHTGQFTPVRHDSHILPGSAYHWENMLLNANDALMRQARALEPDLQASIQKYPGKEEHRLSFGVPLFPADTLAQEQVDEAIRALPAYLSLHAACGRLGCSVAMKVEKRGAFAVTGAWWEPVFTVNVNMPYSMSPHKPASTAATGSQPRTCNP